MDEEKDKDPNLHADYIVKIKTLVMCYKSLQY